MVGSDPGLRVERVRVDRLDLHGATGSAHVRASVADSAGRHDLDEVVHLVHPGPWLMVWDGSPPA